jgi:hypothetical protein
MPSSLNSLALKIHPYTVSGVRSGHFYAQFGERHGSNFWGEKGRRFWWRLFKSTDPTETRNDSAITGFTEKYSIIKL